MCGKLGGEEDRIKVVRAVRLMKPPYKAAQPRELAKGHVILKPRETKPLERLGTLVAQHRYTKVNVTRCGLCRYID
jgi:hypothetical protein